MRQKWEMCIWCRRMVWCCWISVCCELRGWEGGIRSCCLETPGDFVTSPLAPLAGAL